MGNRFYDETQICDINALPPVNSNGKEGVAMKQSR